jgi:hypothetical protein
MTGVSKRFFIGLVISAVALMVYLGTLQFMEGRMNSSQVVTEKMNP